MLTSSIRTATAVTHAECCHNLSWKIKGLSGVAGEPFQFNLI
jgi:hypothetical protein